MSRFVVLMYQRRFGRISKTEVLDDNLASRRHLVRLVKVQLCIVKLCLYHFLWGECSGIPLPC